MIVGRFYTLVLFFSKTFGKSVLKQKFRFGGGATKDLMGIQSKRKASNKVSSYNYITNLDNVFHILNKIRFRTSFMTVAKCI